MKINDNTDPAAKGRAAYTIQELYEKYDDYLFDWETFYRDPERYTFTEDDIMYWNLRELKNYEFDVPMTPAEKRALRKWVVSGHSVCEPRGSRYVFTSRDQDFLDVYRMDREICRELRGQTKAEQEKYLKEYMGWNDDGDDCGTDGGFFEPDEEHPFGPGQENSFPFSPPPREKGRLEREHMERHRRDRELFHLWIFIANEGLQEEAREFLKENMDEPSPFEE